MEFGKYKDRSLGDVPSDYLVWLLRKSKTNVREIRNELKNRGVINDDDESPPPPNHGRTHIPGDLNSPLFRDLLAAGFKSLAQKLHPDHGGDADQMKELNQLRERLKKEFKQGGS
jgi:hypothetical protein